MKNILIIIILSAFNLFARPAFETYFYTNYSLGQNAENYPGGKLDNPASLNNFASFELNPLRYFGELPTERIQNFVPNEALSSNEFALEFWVLYHVNTKVGASIFYRVPENEGKIPLNFGIYANNLSLMINNKTNKKNIILNLDSLVKESAKGEKARDLSYKSWNYQFLMTFKDKKINVYMNKNLIFSAENIEMPEITKSTQVEIASYMHNEPYMDLANLVRYFAVYKQIPDEAEINSKYDLFTSMIDRGILHPDKFHFNAGPYLNYATTNSINIIWETDRPADFMIEYGTEVPMMNNLKINNLNNSENSSSKNLINEIKISDLKPNTKYFYNIKARSASGEMIESGVLTFQTAVQEEDAFSYIVIADTEARAHINDEISKLIWQERPNFMIIAGDLTDGGHESNKYEWNYEYFQGMTQVVSRIPIFPILGNGEGDVYWYDRYHSLPGTGEMYSFKYGNSEYFLLNSNRKADFAQGGAFYNWLDSSLNKSTAKWKFVTFHHAPYSSDEDDYGNSWKGSSTMGDKKIREITPLFDKYNVDMVFYGHLHCYERSYPIKADKIDSDGTYYILAGGAGGNLEDFAPTKTWFNQKTYRGHHYIKIDINDNQLDYFMYNVDGTLLDNFTIKKDK